MDERKKFETRLQNFILKKQKDLLAEPKTSGQPSQVLNKPIFDADALKSGDKRRRRDDYDERLRNSTEFQNPNAVELLCEQFNLPLCEMASFLDIFNSFDSPPESFAPSLRRVQTHKLSMKSVAKGVERLRQNETTIAMQHFNKALQVEPDNAEALVGRGALYANKESFMLAIKDFEDALRIDENHSNAKKYLLETLLAQCKMKYSSVDLIKKSSPSTRKRNRSVDNVEKDIKTQLRELYKKYGVDDKQLVDDPELLENLKKYHEKYSKTMKLNRNKAEEMSEREVLSSYSSESTSSSSSSPSSSPPSKRKESSPKRKKLDYLEKSRKPFPVPMSSTVGPSDKTFRRQITEEKTKFSSSRDYGSGKIVDRRESYPNSKTSSQNANSVRSDGKSLNNGQSTSHSQNQPSKLIEETKLKIDLKNMESFINSLKSKQN